MERRAGAEHLCWACSKRGWTRPPGGPVPAFRPAAPRVCLLRPADALPPQPAEGGPGCHSSTGLSGASRTPPAWGAPVPTPSCLLLLASRAEPRGASTAAHVQQPPGLSPRALGEPVLRGREGVRGVDPAMGPPVTEGGMQGTSGLGPDSAFWPVSAPATALSLAWRWDPLPVAQSLTAGVCAPLTIALV